MSEKTKEWVDWLNTKVLQKVAIADEAGNILSIKRSEYKPGGRPGKWDLPGGSVVPEDLTSATKPHLEAIKREILEETGLEVTDLEVVFIDSWESDRSPGKILGLALGYRAKTQGIKPEPTLSEEHTESRWGNKEEIMKLDFGEDGGLCASIIQKV